MQLPYGWFRIIVLLTGIWLVSARSATAFPEKVTILVDAEFAVPAAVVETVQPVKAGSELLVRAVNGEKLRVSYGLGEALIDAADTDFAQRMEAAKEELAAEQRVQMAAPQNQEIGTPPPAQPSAVPDTPIEQAAHQDNDGITRVASATLTAFYESNELNAERELKGKLIVVVGEVRNVSKSVWGVPYVSMDGSGMWSVYCSFPRQDAELLSKLTKGQTIAVKGKIGTKMMWTVGLDDCVLVD